MTTTEFALFLVEKKNRNEKIFEEFKKLFIEADEEYLLNMNKKFGISYEFLKKLSEQAKKERFEIFVNNIACSFC